MIDAFKWTNNNKGIQADGTIRGMTNTVIGDFRNEHVTVLMSHVIYDGVPETMKDYQDAENTVKTKYGVSAITTDVQKQEVWLNTLNNNYIRRSNKMKIDVTETTCGFEVIIWRWNNSTSTYQISCQYGMMSYLPPHPKSTRMCCSTINKIFLQSHRSSGVMFTNAILTKKP